MESIGFGDGIWGPPKEGDGNGLDGRGWPALEGMMVEGEEAEVKESPPKNGLVAAAAVGSDRKLGLVKPVGVGFFMLSPAKGADADGVIPKRGGTGDGPSAGWEEFLTGLEIREEDFVPFCGRAPSFKAPHRFLSSAGAGPNGGREINPAVLIEAPSLIVPQLFRQKNLAMIALIRAQEEKIAAGEEPTGNYPERKKPLSEGYFDSPTGRLLTSVGMNLVQEHVQTDLLKTHKKHAGKKSIKNSGNIISQKTNESLASLRKNLEESRKNNQPFHYPLKRCGLCNFQTESALVLSAHLVLLKLSGNLKGCQKRFRIEINMEPPLDWDTPAKLPKLPQNLVPHPRSLLQAKALTPNRKPKKQQQYPLLNSIMRKKIGAGIKMPPLVRAPPSSPFRGLVGTVPNDHSVLMISPQQGQLTAPQTMEKSRLDWFFEKLLSIPNFRDLLSKKDVMNLREVCQDWGKIMDNFLELSNDITDRETDYSNYKSIIESPSSLAFEQRGRCQQEICLTPCLNNSSSAGKFYDEAKDHPWNPFLSRRAKVNFVFDDIANYWNHVTAVLDKYGESLSAASLYYVSGNSVLDMLIVVQWSLERMPRVTTLECSFNNFYGEEDYSSTQFNPELPPLDNLRRLVIDMEGIVKPIYKLFVNYFDQIVSLNVRNSKDFMDWYEPELHSKFPSLQQLAICVNGDEGVLRKLLYLTCSLREIDIDCKVGKYLCPSVYLRSVLQFNKSLSAFKLRRSFHCCAPMETLTDLGWPNYNELEFPQLNVISMNIMQCGFGHVDPLLKLSPRSPEFMELDAVDRSRCLVHGWTGAVPANPEDSGGSGDDEMEVDKEEVKIQGYLEDMYKSNVWELFPNLKEMRVRKRSVWEVDPAKPQERRYFRDVYMKL